MAKQMETSQIRDSGESVHGQGDRCDRGDTEAGSNSPDRPQTVEIHAMQFVDTEVNISVNMRRQVPTERKSVEVARKQHSMTRSSRCQG